MFVKPQTPDELQIQMRILKGNHLMLKKRLNNSFSYSGGIKNKICQEYSELFQSLQELHTVMAEVSWQLYVYDLRPKKKSISSSK
jgi:hypothetical protein